MPKYVDIWDILLSLRYNMDSDDNLQLRPYLKTCLCYSLYWEHAGSRICLH